VTVINSSDNPASSVTVPLVDGIAITNATIDIFGSVNIQAESSDATVTQLFVNINDGRPETQVQLVPGGTIQTAFFSGGFPFPPETLTVSSSAGGTATADLAIICSGCRTTIFDTGAPLAVDDTDVCTTTVVGCVLDILSNDGAEADPTTVALVRTPVNGTASVNLVDGTVTYTPDSAGTDANGIIDSYVYTVDSLIGALSSNQATVSINPDGVQPLPPVVSDPPEELSVTRSECRGGRNKWRVEGTSNLLTPHSVTVYAGPITDGIVIATFVEVDNLGDWKIPKNSGPCVSAITIESSEGAVIGPVGVTIN